MLNNKYLPPNLSAQGCGGDEEDEDWRPAGPLSPARPPESHGPPDQAGGVLRHRTQGGRQAPPGREESSQAGTVYGAHHLL